MDVYNMSLQILSDKNDHDAEQFNNKWASFGENYPRLFEMLKGTSPVDLGLLKTMCKKIDSDVPKFEKEKEMGNILAEKYIYTKVEKPTESQLDDAENYTRDRFKITDP